MQTMLDKNAKNAYPLLFVQKLKVIYQKRRFLSYCLTHTDIHAYILYSAFVVGIETYFYVS